MVGIYGIVVEMVMIDIVVFVFGFKFVALFYVIVVVVVVVNKRCSCVRSGVRGGSENDKGNHNDSGGGGGGGDGSGDDGNGGGDDSFDGGGDGGGDDDDCDSGDSGGGSDDGGGTDDGGGSVGNASSVAIACYGLSDLLNEFKLLKSIYVSRHCPRSTVDYPAQVWPPAGFPLYAQNYTSNLLFREEQWGVPAGACTEVGKLFSNKVGQSMSHSIKTPVHFIVDGESSRDNTTAQEMAKGLRTKGVNSTTEWKSIFGDSCRVPFNNDKADQSLNSRLASYPVPCNIDALLSVIQKVLKIPFGPQVNNTVFNISALPNEVKEGLYYGQIDVSATFVEDFLMERMSNLTNTQWFDLTDQELLNVLQIKNYDYNLVYGTDYTGNRMNSNLLDNILK
eukprot:Pgem_evm1s18309